MRRHGGQSDFDPFEGDLPENPAPVPSDHDAGSMHIPDHVVDRFFDRELTRSEATGLFESFRADPDAARRFVQTQRMLDALREPVRAPDLSRSILAKVDRRTPLLTRRGVRHLRLGRGAAAAALVALIAGAFVMQRLNPRIVEIASDEPRPLASLRSTMSLDAADAVNTLQQSAQAIEFTAARAVAPAQISAEASALVPVFPGSAQRFQPVAFVRARLVPDGLFPWRQRSPAPASPAEGGVAWVVPCGTAPAVGAARMGSASDAPCGSSLILIDLKAAPAELPRTPQGRNSGAN